MALNVNRNVEDTFYRYKMPKLVAKVEGKGNGIKTVIVNMVDIAKALSRKPSYPTKYFGCELGAQVYCDEKNDRYIVNGAHDASKLQELLDGFIKKYVLCDNCENPETTLAVKRKQGIVTATCKACGAVSQVDTVHRLTTFIIKNPPESSGSDGGGGKGKGRGKGKRGGGGGGTEEGGDAGGEAAEPEGENGGDGEGDSNEDENDDWGEEATDEARRKRMAELTNAAQALALGEEFEMTEKERADHFFAYISDLKKTGVIMKNIPHIKKEADRLALHSGAVLILSEVLLSPSAVLEDMARYQKVFQIFTRMGESEILIKAQRNMLVALELVIRSAPAKEQLVAKSCRLLKQLYDLDIVEEEAIVSWFDKTITRKAKKDPVIAQIREKCSPMVDWLKTAESEESDEEGEEEEYGEDESDEDEANDTKGQKYEPPRGMPLNSNGPTSKETNGNKAAEQDDDDDVDIDAI